MTQYVGAVGRSDVPMYRYFDDITHLLEGDSFTTLCGKRSSSRRPIIEAQEMTGKRWRRGELVTGLIICKRCQAKA